MLDSTIAGWFRVRILTRYILREVLSHAVLGTALFTFILFMRDVGRVLELVVRKSAPLSTVLEVVAFTLPAALTFTIPMGVLVGILIGLSRLAADCEITAMRASGVGTASMVRIVAIFALGAWLLALLNTVWMAPRAAASLARLQESLRSSQTPYQVQPRVFYEDFRNYVLYVQDTAGTGEALWQGIFLADVSNPAAPKITLAEEGQVVNESPGRLRLLLKNGSQHETSHRAPDQYSITIYGQTVLPISIPQQQASQPRESILLARLSGAELLAEAQRADGARQTAFWIEFHRRLALPTACLVLAMVGIPLGLSSQKGGKSSGFVLTIALVFLYYFASLAGVSLARQGQVPPALGVWMANLMFFSGGAFLLWRVDHASLELGPLRVRWGRMRDWLRRNEGPGGAFERAATRRRVFSPNFPQILDDLIFRDFALYFALVLGSFLVLGVVFTFFELLGDIIRNRVPLVTVGEFLLAFLPSLIYQMTPISVLIAVLVTFGLMEKHNEVTAIKATGTSIYRVAFPVLVVAALLSVGLFLFDHFYLPQTNTRQDALWNAIKGKPTQTYLRPDRKWIFGRHSSIYYYEFYDPDRFQFGGVSVFLFDPKTFEVTQRVFASRADWDPDLGKWLFKQGWTRSFRGAAIQEFRQFDVATFDALGEPPNYFRKEVKQSSQMNYQELSSYIHDLQQSGFDVVRLRVQWHKKFAFPLITFVMAVLAIPFSLSAGRRGALTGVAVAIGIAIAYWMSSGLFEAMGNVSQLPAPLAAWSPDLLFALGGGYLVLRLPT